MARKKLKKNNRKRNFLIQSFIFLFLFIGVGYATLSTNLNISGTLGVSRAHFEPDGTAYGIMEAGGKNRELVKEYTGTHRDSLTEEPSKPIYYFYAENDEEGLAIQNKNNIIFANHCWEIFRTTDTGGVKMIYNGEAENNQCLNTRGKHVGYVQYQEKQTISADYFYGTDYSYDKESNLFTLEGTVEQVTWNSTNSASLKGKYTCKKTTREGTCSKLYQVISYSSATQANVVPLNGNASYYEYGELALQVSASSAAGVGYMYGDPSPIKTVATVNSQAFTSQRTIIQNVALNANHWFADSYDYDPDVTNHFTLVDPYKVTSEEYPNLVDKYTLRNTSETASAETAQYIVGVSGSTSYYRNLTHPLNLETVTKIAFADSITDNGDGTYTLDSPELVTYIDYFNNFANYKNKYTCGNNTITCQKPHYTTETTSTNYTYLTINSGTYIVISKQREGVNLVDTLTIDPAFMIINRSNYTEYKYTCNNDSSVCEESTLRYIGSFTGTGYKYAPNRYFGTSVTWEENHYVLNDIVDLESYSDLTTIKNHRYFCEEYGKKECTSIAFIHRYTSVGSNINYDLISNGTPDIQSALDIMWKKNNYDSFLKKGIDSWYEKYLIDYSEYLEDTVFCNDRKPISYNGWDPTKNPNSYIYFRGGASSSLWSLTCPNEEDQFQVSNPKAKLKYPIAVGTAAELNLLNNNKARSTGNYYWIMTPAFVNELYGRGLAVGPGGAFSSYYNSTHAMGVRPVISLKPGIEIISGDGSEANPYIVDTTP